MPLHLPTTPLKGSALITGGASGLGLGIAKALLDSGMSVTVADVNRSAWQAVQPQLEQRLVAGARLQFLALDLAKPDSIADRAKGLLKKGQPLSLLVNNAGIYPPAQRRLAANAQELSFAIGHLGHFALSLQLLPLLEAAAGKVVSISSLAQRQGRIALEDLTLAGSYTPIVAYRQTKLACLLFAQELHRRLQARSSRVESYAAHPGVVRTALGRNRPVSANDAWWQRLNSALLAQGLGHFGLSPEQAALPVVQIARGQWPAGSFIGPTGWLEMFGAIGHARTGAGAGTPGVAAALWAKSEALTGLTFNR